MIPQYDDMFDTAATDIDRNVMNREENPVGLVVSSEDRRAEARSSRYDSIEFTDSSAAFFEPIEDEELLAGKVKPTVTAYYDTGYDGTPNVYNPSDDKLGERVKLRNNEPAVGKLPPEAYGKPDFFRNSFDLGIASVILIAVVILEIIGLIALF
ncbi:MAG: hypothetical protein II167_03530 [Clostridiales bacterium]|nr:hypothetical protein [Clostridiales bacterium]